MDFNISHVDMDMYKKCEEKWLTIAKPLYSLGELECIINRIGAIRKDINAPVAKRCAVIMCADNGVVSEKISQTDEKVTGIVAGNLAKGMANLNIMTRNMNLDIYPVDIGMKYPPESNSGIIDACIRRSTGNIRKERAMTEDEARSAILAGIDITQKAVNKGYDIIITGEMGIGNTTTSSACAAVLTGMPVSEVTGKGAGLSDEGVLKKIEVIEDALSLHKPDKNNAIDILSKVGGLDIAGMTGVFLGGAVYGVPVVIDGIISAVAANLAVLIDEKAREYMIASHISREPAGGVLLERLSLKPVIDAGLALGEGTGAACILPLIDMAHNVYSQNISFADINMEAYKKL